MKIGIILEKWGNLGGEEQHNISIVRAFLERGHECFLIYGYETEKPANDKLFTLIHKHRDPALAMFTYPEEVSNLSSLLQVIQRESPDVVYLGHINNLAIVQKIIQQWPTITMVHNFSLVCLRWAKSFYFRRKPCSQKCGIGCLLHGCFLGKSHRLNGLLRYNSFKRLLSIQSVYKRVTAIVVPSSFTLVTLVENGFEQSRIYNLGSFNEQVLANTTPLPANGNVLFIGRLDRYKGLDVLLHALAKCKTSPRLVIIGEGPSLNKNLNLSRKLGIKDRVDFVGWVAHDALSEYYNSASVIVVPSLAPETFGKVGIEAMAHARPVIAFNVGGISEWLINEKTGFLVNWKDVNRMSRKIDDIYKDIDQSRKMGIEGRKVVIEKFSKERHMERLEALMHQISKV